MKTIVVIIEKSKDGGYGIYAPAVPGLVGYGLTESEANESCNIFGIFVEEYEERKNNYHLIWEMGN